MGSSSTGLIIVLALMIVGVLLFGIGCVVGSNASTIRPVRTQVFTYADWLFCAQCGRPWKSEESTDFEPVPIQVGELACALIICRSHQRVPLIPIQEPISPKENA